MLTRKTTPSKVLNEGRDRLYNPTKIGPINEFHYPLHPFNIAHHSIDPLRDATVMVVEKLKQIAVS